MSSLTPLTVAPRPSLILAVALFLASLLGNESAFAESPREATVQVETADDSPLPVRRYVLEVVGDDAGTD